MFSSNAGAASSSSNAGASFNATLGLVETDISCVAVSPEDELIASGGDEGKVVLYSRAAAGAGSLSVGEEDDLFLRNQAEA